MNWYVKFYLAILAVIAGPLYGGSFVAHLLAKSPWVLLWIPMWIIGSIALMIHVLGPWLDRDP